MTRSFSGLIRNTQTISHRYDIPEYTVNLAALDSSNQTLSTTAKDKTSPVSRGMEGFVLRCDFVKVFHDSLPMSFGQEKLTMNFACGIRCELRVNLSHF